MKFSGRDYALPVRLECANFVSQMCSTSTVTLQMFIACRGLPVLVDILSTPYAESKALVWLAGDAICSVFELQSTTPKNDFCRLFAKAGLLPVLASVLKLTSEDRDQAAKNFPAKLSNVSLLFYYSATVGFDIVLVIPYLLRSRWCREARYVTARGAHKPVRPHRSRSFTQ